jgi:hypothetical protein
MRLQAGWPRLSQIGGCPILAFFLQRWDAMLPAAQVSASRTGLGAGLESAGSQRHAPHKPSQGMPGLELAAMSGQYNESQPQKDQTSEKAHQRYASSASLFRRGRAQLSFNFRCDLAQRGS